MCLPSLLGEGDTENLDIKKLAARLKEVEKQNTYYKNVAAETSKIHLQETYEAILRIRPGQKDLIVSGFSETDEAREAQRMGAGGLLKKPYAIEKLGNAVRSALASSRSGE